MAELDKDLSQHNNCFELSEEGSQGPLSLQRRGISSRLRTNIAMCRTIGARKKACNRIRYGYSFTFARQLPFNHYRPPKDPTHELRLESEIQHLVQHSTLVEIYSASHVSHCRLEPKKERVKWRLIDLRHNHMTNSSCRHEMVDFLPSMLQKNESLTLIDLNYGYHYLGIHSSSQRFVQIRVGDHFYQFTELMFRLHPGGFRSVGRLTGY